MGTPPDQALLAGTTEASYRYAVHRARTAAAVAHAYIDVRRWQALLALRSEVAEPYRDHIEIARFRREAGLVSTIDGGLAGALAALNEDARRATQVRLDAAMATLADLTGLSADALNAQLGASAGIPDLDPPPDMDSTSGEVASDRADLLALQSRLASQLQHAKVTQTSLDRALGRPVGDGASTPAGEAVASWRRAVAHAEAEIQTYAAAVSEGLVREEALDRRNATARRTAQDARLAYQLGAGDFPSLYVAEVAALGVREAQVEARSARASGTIDLWTARGGGWSAADLTQEVVAAAAKLSGADCE